MHTYHDTGGFTSAHYNSDLSGDVVFSVPPHRVNHATDPENLLVSVPSEVVKAVVMEWVRQQAISRLEKATDEQLITQLAGGTG